MLGVIAGGTRRYDGPFGKSDRALALGVIAALLACGFTFASVGAWTFPLLAALSASTVINRVRAGLKEAQD